MKLRAIPLILDATAAKLNPWLVLIAIGLAIVDALMVLANLHPPAGAAAYEPAAARPVTTQELLLSGLTN